MSYWIQVLKNSGSLGIIIILSVLITIMGLLIVIKDFRKILLYSTITLVFFIGITSYFKLGKANTFNRLFVKTYNQITKVEINKKKEDESIEIKKKKFNFYSTEHEGHILLALKLSLACRYSSKLTSNKFKSLALPLGKISDKSS